MCQEILSVASTYHQHITPAADLVYRRAFNACECCGEKSSSHHMIDHCHKTEIVRGTVCPSCNTKIGKHESVNFNVDYPDYIKDFSAKTDGQDYNPIYAAKMWYKHGDDWKEVDRLSKIKLTKTEKAAKKQKEKEEAEIEQQNKKHIMEKYQLTLLEYGDYKHNNKLPERIAMMTQENKQKKEWEECLKSDWKPEEEVSLSAVEKDDILSSLLKR
jgi:hypothetical protein